MGKRRETLDDLLRALGIGRWQAAVKAGLSPTSVRDWCEGRREPRNEQLAALAKGLDVTVERVAAAAAATRR